MDSTKKLFRKEYDGSFESRFMEALRNHVQHRGIPVHSTTLPGKWTSFDENGELEFSLNMGSLRSFLQEDSEFKKSVLEEMGERVDLKVATRSYIECLNRVHCNGREMIAHASNAARALVEKARKLYSGVYDESLAGLSACAWSDEGENALQQSTVPLWLDWDDIRLRLIEKNGRLINLRKRYVTGRNVK
jgi:hypothetical protein